MCYMLTKSVTIYIKEQYIYIYIYIHNTIYFIYKNIKRF